MSSDMQMSEKISTRNVSEKLDTHMDEERES